MKNSKSRSARQSVKEKVPKTVSECLFLCVHFYWFDFENAYSIISKQYTHVSVMDN